MIDMNELNYAPPSVGVDGLQNLFIAMKKDLTGSAPPGTYYTPQESLRPDLTPQGGLVATVRRYRIVIDRILIPNFGERPANSPEYLEGYATEADLLAARCDLRYLLTMGHIVEDGYAAV